MVERYEAATGTKIETVDELAARIAAYSEVSPTAEAET
jgi:hypothetical protein